MPKKAPGKPFTKKVPKKAPGKPITNFLRVNHLGLNEISSYSVVDGWEVIWHNL